MNEKYEKRHALYNMNFHINYASTASYRSAIDYIIHLFNLCQYNIILTILVCRKN